MLAVKKTNRCHILHSVSNEVNKWTYLAIDNNGAVDVVSQESFAQCVEISFKGGSRIANGDTDMFETREFLLNTLNHLGQGDDLLSLNFALLFANVNDLKSSFN